MAVQRRNSLAFVALDTGHIRAGVEEVGEKTECTYEGMEDDFSAIWDEDILQLNPDCPTYFCRPPVPMSRETAFSGNFSADGRRMDARSCSRHPQSQFVKSCPRPSDASRRSGPVALR